MPARATPIPPDPPATMMAWRSDARGRSGLDLTRIATPTPVAGELLVRVERAGLNFSDLLMVDDRYQVRPERPFTPGQEVAGTVCRAGPGCRLAPGTRVVSKLRWGGFADYAVIRDDMAIALPEEIPLTQAVALPVAYTTAWVALQRCATVNEGDVVLVLGAAGGVGLACVQLARQLGARVIGVAGTEVKRELVRQHGAEQCIDPSRPEWGKALRESGPAVSVVVDNVGGAATMEAIRSLDWDGQLLIVGFASGEIPQIPAHRLLLRRVRAQGVYWDHDRDAALLERAARDLCDRLRDGQLDPLVHDFGPLDTLPRALERLAAREVRGKLCLHVDSHGNAP